jgi:Ca2+-binding RTX toxin-like protein
MHRCALPFAVIASAAAFASPASATTSVVSDGQNLLIGSDDQASVVGVEVYPFASNKLRVTELSKPLILFAGCVYEGADKRVADCADAPHIAAQLGGGEDVLSVDTYIPVEAYGQMGDDAITGGSADDDLEGNGGADVVKGDVGNDSVSDGDRTDAASGSGGNDLLSGGDGDDMIDGGPLPGGGAGADTLDGGPGADVVDYSRRVAPIVVTEGAGADDGAPGEGDNVLNGETILGGSAGDFLAGAGEPNVLRGGRGNDVLDGGGGSDVLEGGAGNDLVTYASRTVPVSATLDGEPGDGASGEGDAIDSAVEGLTGGYEGDTLTGSSGANALNGRGGNDVLDGAGGDDALSGGDAADTLTGASGDDSLSGGDGSDAIDPGTGADTVDAGPGDDVVHARDAARDTIACGAGADTVVADPYDAIAADCESVDPGSDGGGTPPDGSGATPPDGTGPQAADHTGPVLRLPARVVLARHGKLARVRIACPAAEGSVGCRSVRLTVLARGGKKIGRARTARIAGGKALTLKLRLRVVPKRAKLRASAADAAGNRATVHRAARIARKR